MLKVCIYLQSVSMGAAWAVSAFLGSPALATSAYADGPDAPIIDARAVQESDPSPDFELSYTSTLGREFPIYVFAADESVNGGPDPAIVMYHGGGWRAGTPNQFYRHARVWNQLGVTVILPVYALGRTHDATVWQSLEDAFLSFEAIHESADDLGIDPDAIAAGGGSAGGHLAAALATVDPPASVGDHRPPAALVLFNPVIDNSLEGYGADRIGEEWRSFSPFHNIGDAHPPTLFMLGDRDILIPVETGEAYCEAVRAAGAACELIIYPEAPHSWFNQLGFTDTLRHSTEFLAEVFSLGPLAFTDSRDVDAFLLIEDGAGDYDALPENTIYDAPQDHVVGSPLYRYQGPVVEGETFGVRAYFDARARFDVFNKTGPELVLRSARNDYHAEADWGRDTLLVGDSLGFATPAILSGTGLEPPRALDRRQVTILTSDRVARFTLHYEGWSVAGVELDAEHRVVMRVGADYVEHALTFDRAPPASLVTGLVRHEAGEMRTGEVDGARYLLTYGPQSDLGRGLGLAVIVPQGTAGPAPEDAHSHLAALVMDEDDLTARYWATADWAFDPDFAPDIDAFETKVRLLAAQAASQWYGEDD